MGLGCRKRKFQGQGSDHAHSATGQSESTVRSVEQTIEIAHWLEFSSDRLVPTWLTRYADVKHVNATVHRQLIKELQRLTSHASIDRQAVDCIRSIEARMYPFDRSQRLTEPLIRKLESRLKQILHTLPRPFELNQRLDICNKLHEFIENHLQASSSEQSDEFLTAFDAYAAQIKQNPFRLSRTRYNLASSQTTLSKMSPSLQSMQSVS